MCAKLSARGVKGKVLPPGRRLDGVLDSGVYNQAMERERLVEPSVEPPVPSSPIEADKSDITHVMLHAQAHGGNQMVARAVADNPLEDRLRSRLGGGRPLSADVRAEAETGFGRPMGDVRVHTDGHAASMATELNAHAFTVGQDVFFGQGQFDPSS